MPRHWQGRKKHHFRYSSISSGRGNTSPDSLVISSPSARLYAAKCISNGQEVGEWLPQSQSIALLQLRNPAGRYHSYFIPGKDYLSGPWEMYWSVFLFPPAITWQRHLGGEWMSDARSVCSGVVAASVHWWVERCWGRRRDNAVINSVWTSSVCTRGGPLVPGSQVSGKSAFLFFWLLSCQWRLFSLCSDDRNTCRRGSLVPADKCMLRVAVVQLTLAFKSDAVWSGHLSFHNRILVWSGFPVIVSVAMMLSQYVWQFILAAKRIYIFALFSGMSDLILSMKPCI